MKILLTGSASHLARAVLPRLCRDPRVQQVIGADIRESVFSHARYRHQILDIRSPALDGPMGDVDAVVHLAFVLMCGDLGTRRYDRAWMHDVNVRGSCNVFRAVAERHVSHLIHCSSAAVYRIQPTDSLSPARRQTDGAKVSPITESHPLGALPGFAYAEDKIAVERRLDGLQREYPELRVVRLRPHAILGPHAQPLLRVLLRAPFYPRLPDPQPLTQCVHEDDVAEAIVSALFGDSSGAFNLAPADAVSFRDMQITLHRWPVAVPLSLTRAAFRAAWHMFALGTDPAWIDGFKYDLVLDSRRAKHELAWRPHYDSVRECLRAMDRTT